MPVYEYQCGACGHAFEEWQKIKDPPVRTCPSCAKEAVERLISQTAFQLKGGGWYKDLYSSGKPKEAAKSSGEAAKTGGDSGGGEKKAADSKPSDSGKGGGSTGGGSSSGGSAPSSGGGKTSAAAAPS